MVAERCADVGSRLSRACARAILASTCGGTNKQRCGIANPLSAAERSLTPACGRSLAHHARLQTACRRCGDGVEWPGSGAVVKEAAAAQWGGYAGYFSDPDGHLWKVATEA